MSDTQERVAAILYFGHIAQDIHMKSNSKNIKTPQS
jgi:hypothetical protein